MATLESISEALTQITTKKSTLLTAFESLKNHPHSPSSFTLSWSDIDSYITTSLSSLQSRFLHLQSIEQQSRNRASELREICVGMNGPKLREFLKEHCGKRGEIEGLVFECIGFAPDPARLVLDTVEVCLGLGEGENWQCGLLLEGLMGIEGLKLSHEVREEARRVATELKGQVRVDVDDGSDLRDVMTVMRFLAGFRLVEVVEKGEVVGFVDVLMTRFKKLPRARVVGEICCALGLSDHELIQGLVSMGKPAHALRLIYQLKLIEKCPPVPLLKSYLQDMRNHVKTTCANAKTLATSDEITSEEAAKMMAEAFHKEFHAYDMVLNLIIAYNLGAIYPIEDVRYKLKVLRSKVQENKPVATQLKVLRNELSKENVAVFAERAVPKQQELHTPANPEASSSELSAMERNVGELRQICESMETVRLREWLKGSDTNNNEVQFALQEALKLAPDLAKLVLDVIDGYMGPSCCERPSEKVIRDCFLLLEGLIGMEGLNVTGEVKEAARRVATEWKEKTRTRTDEMNHVDALMVLMLLAGFRIGEDLDEGEVIEFVDITLLHFKGFRYLKLVADIYMLFQMADKLPELVRSHVMRRGRPQEALELINELKLSDKCPPVPLLKSYVQEAKKNVEVTCEKVDMLLASGGCSFEQASNYKAEAFAKELAAMEVVVRLLREHNLGSYYSDEPTEAAG